MEDNQAKGRGGEEGHGARAMLGTPEEEDQSLGESARSPPQLLSPREQVFLETPILQVKSSALLLEAQVQGHTEC